MNFLQLIQDYLKENPKAKNTLRHLDFSFQQWWNNFLVRLRHIFDKVYKFKNNHLYVHKEQSSTLPLFIRNVHHHYAERGKRQVVMFSVFCFDHFDFDFDFFFSYLYRFLLKKKLYSRLAIVFCRLHFLRIREIKELFFGYLFSKKKN